MKSLRRKLGALYASIFRRDAVIVVEKILTSNNFRTKTKIEVNLKFCQQSDFAKNAAMFKRFKIDAGEMFESGNTCIVGEANGEIVHWTWIALSDVHITEIEKKIRISPSSAWVYAGYTAPDYRGLGIAPRAMEEIFSYLRDKGIQKVYATIRPNNLSSLQYTHKIGFKKIGLIKFIKICKLKLYRCKSETKEDHDNLKRIISS